LDQIQDPGNAGALVRAAVAFDIDGIIWHTPCVYPYHHACIRASAGAVFHIRNLVFQDENLSDLNLIGAESRGEYGIQDFSWPRDLVLVMGNEGHGLSALVRKHLKTTVSIPIPGKAESLNVAGAAHILLYRLYCQGRD
jgi:tRNA G18 (ribose-2'-O)-methylase SpoU